MKRLSIYTMVLLYFPQLFCQIPLDDETTIGLTYYDMQTLRSMQNRVYAFDDGTKGAVWNQGNNYPGFEDLGVGYNYYDGNSWGDYPEGSITSAWAFNPSYTNYGENGEICISEGGNGLIINWREEKGTGNWQESLFEESNLKHPVVVTSGPDDAIVHLLYLKADLSFTPTPAQPCRGQLWYSRSSDGMQTWEINMEVPGLGLDNYLGFTPGAYSWAEPQDDILAFVAGDYLTDLVLMKSEDEGSTWEKTIIWEHPYPLLELFSFESDSFYCNGGSMSVVLEETGFSHVAFALSKVFSTTQQDTLWHDPYVGGIAYWREDMPAFQNTMNSLNPDSLSVCDNLIAWMQDIDGNGSIDLLNPPVYPSLGLCIMPNLAISDYGNIFLVYSSVTEFYDNGLYNFHHLWSRAGLAGPCYWSDFIDLTDDLIHIFDECVYPSMVQFADDQLYLTYQIDNDPGLSPDMGGYYTENRITFMEVDLGWEEGKEKEGLFVDFRINQDSIYEGDTVWFQNLSCGCPFPYSFTWGFEGGTPGSSNESNPAVVYNNAGIYDVNLHAGNGQSTNLTIKPDYITVYPLSALSEIKELSAIRIFPNPVVRQLNIQFDKPACAVVRVLGMMGQIVFEKEYGYTDQIRINHLELPAGVYMVEVGTNDAVHCKMIVIGE